MLIWLDGEMECEYLKKLFIIVQMQMRTDKAPDKQCFIIFHSEMGYQYLLFEVNA